MSTGIRWTGILLLPFTLWINSALPAPADSAAGHATTAVDQGPAMSEVIALLKQQQKELAEQRRMLEAQATEIAGLKSELDVLRAPTPPVTEDVAGAESREGAATPEQVRDAKVVAQAQVPEVVSKREQKAETGKAVAQAQVDDPTRALLSEFQGAWRLPGTDAALRIGGFVKTAVVYNFDPLQISDRFIVGSIPVDTSDVADVEAQSSLTASQSRLNFDLREPTELGIMRAFIEGDFAGDGETFRLRHAFGQWNRVLAGKTWSAFVDTEATPEEVDFEGLNGRINVRQAQVRLMPKRGSEYGLEVSLEDPNPEVQNGQGVTRVPDLVLAGRFSPHSRLHLKVGLLGRQIRAQPDPGLGFGSGVYKKYAWGTTVSGRFVTPLLDKRDNLVFQLNYGDGIGRYVNDLSSVGAYDGIFNPETGAPRLFKIAAGYAGWQHWWGGNYNMRSNFIFGFVDIDNPDFVAGDAYKSTLRFSSNLVWSPTPRIDLGAEYLWGRRENQNGDEGDATQIQMAARYRF